MLVHLGEMRFPDAGLSELRKPRVRRHRVDERGMWVCSIFLDVGFGHSLWVSWDIIGIIYLLIKVISVLRRSCFLLHTLCL